MAEITTVVLPENLTLENALERLEEIVADLEADDLSLEEALQVYEEGVLLSQFCEEQLDAATLRIEEISPESK